MDLNQNPSQPSTAAAQAGRPTPPAVTAQTVRVTAHPRGKDDPFKGILSIEAPLEALEVAALLPEYPRSVPLTFPVWQRVIAAAQLIHPPNSEFSFFTSHLWGGGDDIRLSRIGGVVVIQFTDLPDHATLVPLPGTLLPPTTVAKLAAFLSSAQVRLLTEPAQRILKPALTLAGMEAVSQRDDADPVVDMARVSMLAGPDFSGLRRDRGRLQRHHGDALHLRSGRLSDPAYRAILEDVHDQWLACKRAAGGSLAPELTVERRGIDAWPRDHRAADIRVFAAFSGDTPLGVSVVEPLWDRLWTGIVMKVLPATGHTPWLRSQLCGEGLAELGEGARFCLQQDTGVLALRESKMRYRPELVPKYSALRVPIPNFSPGPTTTVPAHAVAQEAS